MRTSVLNALTTFIWRMIRLNFLFAVANTVLIVTILTIPLSTLTLPVYILGAFLFVPTLIALLLAMKRLDDESPPMRKLYFTCYREEFQGSMRFAIAYVIGALILLAAFVFAQDLPTPIPIVPLYVLLSVLLYVHFIFGLVIRISFIIDVKGTWRLGLYCISKYPLIALYILAGTFAIWAIVPIMPFLIPFGIIPAAFYLLLFTTKKMIRNISDVLNITKNKQEEESIESEDDSK
ncbi:MAG: hypothetical protein FWC13_09300 [Oscillospiraceae bacterium]|nr:hypothetical protein [Oscillospiraceae bacterium]